MPWVNTGNGLYNLDHFAAVEIMENEKSGSDALVMYLPEEWRAILAREDDDADYGTFVAVAPRGLYTNPGEWLASIPEFQPSGMVRIMSRQAEIMLDQVEERLREEEQ